MYEKMYKITKENLIGHEFIGLKVKVINSTDLNKKGLEGIIKRESKNLIEIQTKKGVKKIPKKEAILEFVLPEKKEKITINGNKIVYRPENRIKLLVKKHGM